jgi:hypothetical protein
MAKYKGFREQFLECGENGNLIRGERCSRCGQELLICKKYGGQCMSIKCRDERITEED